MQKACTSYRTLLFALGVILTVSFLTISANHAAVAFDDVSKFETSPSFITGDDGGETSGDDGGSFPDPMNPCAGKEDGHHCNADQNQDTWDACFEELCQAASRCCYADGTNEILPDSDPNTCSLEDTDVHDDFLFIDQIPVRVITPIEGTRLHQSLDECPLYTACCSWDQANREYNLEFRVQHPIGDESPIPAFVQFCENEQEGLATEDVTIPPQNLFQGFFAESGISCPEVKSNIIVTLEEMGFNDLSEEEKNTIEQEDDDTLVDHVYVKLTVKNNGPRDVELPIQYSLFTLYFYYDSVSILPDSCVQNTNDFIENCDTVDGLDAGETYTAHFVFRRNTQAAQSCGTAPNNPSIDDHIEARTSYPPANDHIIDTYTADNQDTLVVNCPEGDFDIEEEDEDEVVDTDEEEPAPTAPCCFTANLGGCDMLTEAECIAAPGQWFEAYETCTEIEEQGICIGACCHQPAATSGAEPVSTCTMLTLKSRCTNLTDIDTGEAVGNPEWHGWGSTCTVCPSPPAGGACCNVFGGSLWDTTQASYLFHDKEDCDVIPGTWLAGKTVTDCPGHVACNQNCEQCQIGFAQTKPKNFFARLLAFLFASDDTPMEECCCPEPLPCGPSVLDPCPLVGSCTEPGSCNYLENTCLYIPSGCEHEDPTDTDETDLFDDDMTDETDETDDDLADETDDEEDTTGGGGGDSDPDGDDADLEGDEEDLEGNEDPDGDDDPDGDEDGDPGDQDPDGDEQEDDDLDDGDGNQEDGDGNEDPEQCTIRCNGLTCENTCPDEGDEPPPDEDPFGGDPSNEGEYTCLPLEEDAEQDFRYNVVFTTVTNNAGESNRSVAEEWREYLESYDAFSGKLGYYYIEEVESPAQDSDSWNMTCNQVCPNNLRCSNAPSNAKYMTFCDVAACRPYAQIRYHDGREGKNVWIANSERSSRATVAHELAHTLGLVDLYVETENSWPDLDGPNCVPTLEQAQNLWQNISGINPQALGCSYSHGRYVPTPLSLMSTTHVEHLDFSLVEQAHIASRLDTPAETREQTSQNFFTRFFAQLFGGNAEESSEETALELILRRNDDGQFYVYAARPISVDHGVVPQDFGSHSLVIEIGSQRFVQQFSEESIAIAEDFRTTPPTPEVVTEELDEIRIIVGLGDHAFRRNQDIDISIENCDAVCSDSTVRGGPVPPLEHVDEDEESDFPEVIVHDMEDLEDGVLLDPTHSHFLRCRGVGVLGEGQVTGTFLLYEYDGAEPPFEGRRATNNPAIADDPDIEQMVRGRPYFFHSTEPHLYSCNSGFTPQACGNGLIGPGEQCDDRDRENGDGCSSDCRIERTFQCSGEPSVCQRLLPTLPQ